MPLIGNMRSRVTVQEPYMSSGAQGWRTWPGLPGGKAYALLDAQHGTEMTRGVQPPDLLVSSVVMRYVKGLRKRMRLLTSDGRTLEILSVFDREGKHRELDLVCREVVS